MLFSFLGHTNDFSNLPLCICRRCPHLQEEQLLLHRTKQEPDPLTTRPSSTTLSTEITLVSRRLHAIKECCRPPHSLYWLTALPSFKKPFRNLWVGGWPGAWPSDDSSYPSPFKTCLLSIGLSDDGQPNLGPVASLMVFMAIKEGFERHFCICRGPFPCSPVYTYCYVYVASVRTVLKITTMRNLKLYLEINNNSLTPSNMQANTKFPMFVCVRRIYSLLKYKSTWGPHIWWVAVSLVSFKFCLCALSWARWLKFLFHQIGPFSS